MVQHVLPSSPTELSPVSGQDAGEYVSADADSGETVHHRCRSRHRSRPATEERILIEADLFTPPAPNTPPPAMPSAAATSLYNNVQRLKLPVDRVAPLHGRVVPWNEFLQFVGKAGTQ
jgi:hypothetical protein